MNYTDFQLMERSVDLKHHLKKRIPTELTKVNQVRGKGDAAMVKTDVFIPISGSWYAIAKLN
jgi:hypothetical protein